MCICPRCGLQALRTPAISRYDDQTYVCVSCGVLEALWVAGHPFQPVPGFDMMLEPLRVDAVPKQQQGSQQ